MELEILNRGISIDRLQTFSKVVEHGSISAAAGGDPNRQSLYSRQIRQLEEALEQVLFIREGRSMRLNENGRKLAVMTNAYFAALNEFAFGEAASTIRIGTGESVLEALIYPRFKAMRKRLEGRRFEFICLPTREIVKELAAGGLDFGVIREDAELQECHLRAVGSLEFELVVPRSLFPTPSNATIDKGTELPVASLSGTGSFVRLLRQKAQQEGLTFRTEVMADSFSKLAALVESGEVAAVLPTPLARRFTNEKYIRYRSNAFKALSRPLVLAVAITASELRPSLTKSFEILSGILSH